MCNHSIILHGITKYPNTMHREVIEVDTYVEEEAGEDLDEAEDQ
jgi:hypothetical protein